MGSWWPSGTVFPPLPVPVILDSLPSGRRRTSDHAGRRLRPERHNPHSIATLRMVLALLLLRQLPHCPLLRFVPRLSVGVEIDFINAGLLRGAWFGVPRLSAQLDLAEFLYRQATPKHRDLLGPAARN